MDPWDSPLPPPIVPRSTPNKETPASLSSKIAELSESRSELLGRIQGLKQDLQSWRSKLDTQVKVYRDELQELKNSLNHEVVVLQTEFKDLRTTLLQQQNDVEASLRNLQDGSGEVENPRVTANEELSFIRDNELPKENGEVIDNLSSSSQTEVLH